MTLHGQVYVQDQAIGYWSARRTEPLERGRDGYTYDCWVAWHASTDRAASHVSFSLLHNYSEGAGALAAKVLGYDAGLRNIEHVTT